MSKTSLQDHFKEKIGIGPKLFSRITRFNNVFNFMRQNKMTNWQEIVVKFGYHDQNHFIREFKAFFGYTPTQIGQSSHDISQFISQQLKLQ